MIFIPISENKIVYTTPKNKKFVVLLYTIKRARHCTTSPKENGNATRTSEKINGLSDDSIREGGELIIGWYVFDQVKTEKIKLKNQMLKEKR